MFKAIGRWFKKSKPPLSFYIHTQRDGWGFGWIQDGQKMLFFRGRYGPWVNLSEDHCSSNCQDPAYCPWHGML